MKEMRYTETCEKHVGAIIHYTYNREGHLVCPVCAMYDDREDLKEQIDELENEIRELTNENERLENECDKLEEQNDILERRIREFTA